MNKYFKELIDKCDKNTIIEGLNNIKGLYIISDNKLHSSGYRLIHVIAHTDYYEEIEDYKYYYLGCSYDVIHFKNFIIKQGFNLDIDRHGIIHLWLTGNTKMKTDYWLGLSDLFINIGE